MGGSRQYFDVALPCSDNLVARVFPLESVCAVTKHAVSPLHVSTGF